MSLDVLFQQILRSEQKAEDRRSEIVQVNNEILESEKERNELLDIINNAKQKLKGEEMCVLYNKEAELEILTVQTDSLLQQRDKLQHEVGQLKIVLNENETSNECDFNHFINEVDAFVDTYSLAKPQPKHFQNQQLDELKSLKQEKMSLEQELKETKNQEEKWNAVSKQCALLEADVSHLRTTIIDLDSQLEEKRQIVNKKRVELENVPAASSDPEYCRLQAELHSMDNEATEAEVLHLRSELALLQSKKKKVID